MPTHRLACVAVAIASAWLSASACSSDDDDGGGSGGAAGAGGQDSGTTCVQCTNSSCQSQVSACISDQTCVACQANPSGPGCATHPTFAPLLACVCQSCANLCTDRCPDGG